MFFKSSKCINMQRSLLAYPLPDHVRFKLNEAGYRVVEDLQGVSSLSLSEEANITREEATSVLDLTCPSGSSKACRETSQNIKTALQLLKTEQDVTYIVTFCKSLDNLLNGGIPLGKLTEICGAPGTGKTQLCLQLCVDVQLQKKFGGLCGEAVIIDTEGSFSTQRLAEIASAAVQHCQRLEKQIQRDINVENFLKGIYYYRCCTYVELIAIINLLQFEFESKPQICLLVIDSIAFHFRYGFDGNFADRTRILNSLAQSLIKIASEKNIAIVLTNEMTTRFGNDNSSYLVPSLGESWAHVCATQIFLFWDCSHRKALLYKAPLRKEEVITFQITQEGIRDVPSPHHNIANIVSASQSETSRKRLRSDSM